jgi:hypothetical protein
MVRDFSSSDLADSFMATIKSRMTGILRPKPLVLYPRDYHETKTPAPINCAPYFFATFPFHQPGL